MNSRWKQLAAVGCVLLFGLLAVRIARSKPSPIHYPSPNGFDDLLKAAELLQPLPGKSQDPTQLSAEERKWLIQSNSAALKLLHEGLAKEIRVVIPDYPTMQSAHNLAVIKNLSQLLAEAARGAAASSNKEALLTACFDNYALGSRGLGGGQIIEGLVSLGIRNIAIGSMDQITRLGDAALCRQAALRLHAAVTNAPSAQPYLDEEAAWERRLPFTTRFHLAILWQKLNGTTSALPRLVLAKFTLIRQRESETLRDLAATAFRLEHQRAATNWTELVPEYLPEIPRNATNNAPLPLIGG